MNRVIILGKVVTKPKKLKDEEHYHFRVRPEYHKKRVRVPCRISKIRYLKKKDRVIIEGKLDTDIADNQFVKVSSVKIL